MTFYEENFYQENFYSVVDRDRVGSVRIVLPDPGRDRNAGYDDPNPVDSHPYQFQANEKVEKVDFFPENFNILKHLKHTTRSTLMRKIKHCKVAML